MSLESVWALVFLLILIGAGLFVLFERPGSWLSRIVRSGFGSAASIVAVAAIVGASWLADRSSPIPSEEGLRAGEQLNALRTSLEKKEAKLASFEEELEKTHTRLAYVEGQRNTLEEEILQSEILETKLANLEQELTNAQRRLASVEGQRSALEQVFQQSEILETKLARTEEENRAIQAELNATQVALQSTTEGLRRVLLSAAGWPESTLDKLTIKTDAGEPPVALPLSLLEAMPSGSSEPFVLFGIGEKADLTAYFSEAIAEPVPFQSLTAPDYRLHLTVEIGEGRGCWLSPEGYRRCLAIRAHKEGQIE